VIGNRLFWPWKLAQQRLLGALVASVVLHAVLLGQLRPAALPYPAPEPEAPVLVAHLLLPAPSFKPPPVAPIAPTERAIAGKQNTRRTLHQPPLSVADAPTATAMPTDTHNLEPQEPPPSAPSIPYTDRPLDLSPQVIRRAVQRNVTPSLAQAAREQLGHEPASAAARLGQHIASGAVPDCLHNAPDGEAKSKPVAIGGLFALPFVAYAAMTGKCR
jgi:hypothetical protein